MAIHVHISVLNNGYDTCALLCWLYGPQHCVCASTTVSGAACLCYSQLSSVLPSITVTVNITVEQYQFYN